MFIIYVKGSQNVITKLCISLSECRMFLPLQKVKALMKCYILWHFILIFTVCQLKVYSIQRAKSISNSY